MVRWMNLVRNAPRLLKRRRAHFRPALCGLEDRTTPSVGGGYTAAGLVGQYFANSSLTGTPAFSRTDVRIDFAWDAGVSPGGSTAPGFSSVGSQNYSIQWTGQIVSAYTETYTFAATDSDGMRVLLRPAGTSTYTSVVNAWNGTGTPAETDGTYALTAGQAYDIEVQVRELTGTPTYQLAWSSPSTPREVIEPLGTTGTTVDNYGPYIFADLMKSSRTTWGTVTDLYNGSVATDANGWPTGDASNIVWEGRAGPDMDGTYLLQFTGQAALSYSLGTATFSAGGTNYGSTLPLDAGYSSSTNLTTATISVTAGQPTFVLIFSQTKRTSNSASGTGVTNVRLMRPISPGSTTYEPLGTVYSTAFKAALSADVALRWNDTNSDAESGWSQRTSPGYKDPVANTSTDQKWAYEYQVLLANELGKDLYLTVPINATDTYLTDLADLIRYGSDGANPYTSAQANPVYPPLNPNLKVYLEMSNEIWNTASAFQQTSYADQDAQAAAAAASGTEAAQEWAAIDYDGTLPTGGGQNVARFRRWDAIRTVYAGNIFRSVFEPANTTTALNRVRPLIEYDYLNDENTAVDSLQFIDDYYNDADGIAHVSTPHPVSYYIWGAGGATYYSTSNPSGTLSTNPLGTGSSLETPVLSANSFQADPTGSGWTFSGAAGIVSDSSRTSVESSQTLGSSQTASANAAYGYSFTVGSSALEVYDLGRWISTGNGETHEVRIIQASNLSTLADLVVNSGGLSAGQYAYATLPKPIALSANTTYYILSIEYGSGDTFYGSNTTVTPVSGIAINGAVSATLGTVSYDPTTWSYTVGSSAGHVYGPVNFRYATAQTGNLGYVPDAPLGTQAMYLASGGSASITITLAAGTYALSFEAAGKAGTNMQYPFDIYVDGTRYTPNYIVGSGALTTVNSAPWTPGEGLYAYPVDEYESYGSAPFTVAAGTHTIALYAEPYSQTDPNAATFLDNLGIASAAAILGSSVPVTGQATGESGTGNFPADVKTTAVYAQGYGLHFVAYEGGWSLGGDFGATPLQSWVKYDDSATAALETAALNDFAAAGGSLEIAGTYNQFDANNIAGAAGDPLVQSVATADQSLPGSDTNGIFAPATLTPSTISWENNATGATVSADGSLNWNIIVPTAGTYAISLSTGSGGKAVLSLDDATVVASGTSGAGLSNSEYLTAGLHSIRVAATSGPFAVTSVTVVNPGAPSAPMLSGLADGSASATLTYTAVSGATGYVIRYGTTSGNYTQTSTVGNVTSATVIGLSGNTVYYFAVSALGAGGEGLPSNQLSADILVYGQTGVLAQWNFGSIPATATSPTTYAPVSTSLLSVGSISRGSGLDPSYSSFASSFRQGRFLSEPIQTGTYAYTYGTDITSAITRSQYYQFTVATPGAYESVSLASISFAPWIQNDPSTGGIGLQYSTDGTNFFTVGTQSANSESTDTFSLSGIAALQAAQGPITLRAYIYGETNAAVTGFGQTGTGDIVLNGSVTALPGVSVQSLVIDDGTAQRSKVRSLTLKFGGLVTLPSNPASAFTLVGPSGGVTPIVSSSSTSTNTTITLTFSSSGTTSLADGRYTLTVLGSQLQDTYGRPLDAGGTGQLGSSYTAKFLRLFGDVNGDGTVDTTDYIAFANAYGFSTGNPSFHSYFDVNGDGTIDTTDYIAFANNYGKSV